MDASRNRKIGIAAVGSVALVAAGTAFAAGKLSHSGSTANTASGSGDLIAAGTQSGGSGGYGFGYGRRDRGFGRFGFGRAGGPFHGGDDLTAAATYLGTTAGDLQSKLSSGQTLAQIADATSGKSASGLIDALVTHEKTELQQAVTDGKLTQTQADQLETNLTDRITALVNHTKPAGPGPGGHFGIGPFHGGDDLTAAATYLGTTAGDLQSKLSSGQTLAQIADATSGKSASGLIDALVTHEKTELQQAVTDGKLTQTQADQLETNLTDRITALVNHTKPAGAGPRGHFKGRGFKGGGGPWQAPATGQQNLPATHI